ncbi:hypothetical protein F5141DRAFT_1130995 [Pisolithus sp. B1]|nr:hypothetical protein F5141DRAFT_1130995 [Pisolithus sp. B1]
MVYDGDQTKRKITAREVAANMANQATIATESSVTVDVRRIETEDALELRHSVLWPTKPLSYVRLPEDDLGYHFGAFSPRRSKPIAVISLFLEAIPMTCGASEPAGHPVAVRFRKFACHPNFQGRGIGTKLLRHVMTECTKLGATVMWCDARVSTCDWYRRRGMEAFGVPFYKGSVEYTRMKMDVSMCGSGVIQQDDILL